MTEDNATIKVFASLVHKTAGVGSAHGLDREGAD